MANLPPKFMNQTVHTYVTMTCPPMAIQDNENNYIHQAKKCTTTQNKHKKLKPGLVKTKCDLYATQNN